MPCARIAKLMAVASILAVGISPAVAQARTLYPNCASHLRYKPKSLILFCADAGVTAQRVRWYRWGAREARGASRYVYAKTCVPDCATGGVRRYRARFVLRRVRTCAENGERVFTRLAVIFGRRHPPGLTKFTQRLQCRSSA
jgi:hypothetical protein